MQGKEVNLNIITDSLLDQDMCNILDQFFKLEDFLDHPSKHIQEWFIIKLVTIIEQFCREIVKNQIDTDVDIPLPQELHITVAKLDRAKKISTSSLIASQYNFQNMQTIINELKRYKIDDFLKGVNKNELDELFRIRHDIIHTISSTQNYNIKNGYKATQNLLKKILQKSTYGMTYYENSHGIYFGLLKKYDEAINCFTNALKINSNDIAAHYYIGLTYIHENNPRETYDRSTTIIHLNPKSHLGYYLQGLSFQLQKRYDDVIKCCDKAIKMKPDFAFVYYLQGHAFQSQEKYEDAVKCCNKAIKMKPDFASAYYRKYTLLFLLNRSEEAKRCRKTAIEIDPNGDYPPILNDKKRM